MKEADTWDPDFVSGATYSRAMPGLNAIYSFSWQDLEIQWHVGADNIWRQYERGKLTAVTTPEAGLPVALFEELAAIKLHADDIITMVSDSACGEIHLSVNENAVTGTRRSDGRYDWRTPAETPDG